MANDRDQLGDFTFQQIQTSIWTSVERVSNLSTKQNVWCMATICNISLGFNTQAFEIWGCHDNQY